MQYWPLYVLPVSFSIMLSRFIHVVADGKVSLFLRLNDIPVYILCVCVCVCLCDHFSVSFILKMEMIKPAIPTL